MRVAVISCSAKKQSYKCEVREMYSKSPLFSYTYSYVKKMNFDKCFILSSKYGLLKEDEIIDTYDETLKDKTKKEREEWSEKIVRTIKEKFNKEDELFFFCGKQYYKDIINKIDNIYFIVLGNMKIGERLQWLKKRVEGGDRS